MPGRRSAKNFGETQHSIGETKHLVIPARRSASRNSGRAGVLNLITKSGTNQIHDTGRWLIRSNALNALTNDKRAAGLKEPAVFTKTVFEPRTTRVPCLANQDLDWYRQFLPDDPQYHRHVTRVRVGV